MSAPRQIEKSLSTLIVLVVAAAAWLPPAVNLWGQPYASRTLIPVSAAMVLIAMALLFEAAARPRLNRAVYASVVFATLPAVMIAATHPSVMSSAALLLLGSGSVFLAERAIGDGRPVLLGTLALLLLAAGAVCGFHAAALGFVFPALLAAGDLRRNWKTALGLTALIAVGVAGGLLVPLPRLVFPSFDSPLSPVFLLLPWTAFVLPALLQWRRAEAEPDWRRLIGAVIAFVALIVAVAVRGESLIGAAAALTPFFALLGADLLQTDFARAKMPKARFAVAVPLGLTALALVGFIAFTPAPFRSELQYSHADIVIASVLAVSAVWIALHRLPRAAFFVLALAGVFLGYLSSLRDPREFWQSPDPVLLEGPEPVSRAFGLLVLAACAAAAVLAAVIRKRCFSAQNKTPDQEYRFGADNFVLFSQREPLKTTLAPTLKTPFTFAVFGDVTGAESLFAARRGGYFTFRALARTLSAKSPAFAVSLGDLARQATPAAYRAMRRLLKRIAVPLIVSPGNHDLFIGNQYHAAQFHDLFGADNCAFDAGPLRIVILNNAWGCVGDPQFAWLEQALAKPRPFTFVFCHKPVFELRRGPFYAMETREHADRLHEIFRSRGVTAVLSGHIHSLLHDVRDGVAYIVSGGGGSKLVSADDRHHYLLADVADTEILLRAWPLERKSSEKNAPLLELRFTIRP